MGGGSKADDHALRSAADAANASSKRGREVDLPTAVDSEDRSDSAEGVAARQRAETARTKNPAEKPCVNTAQASEETKDAAARDNPYGGDPRYEASFGHSGIGGNGVGADKD
jgi:hypothetical protein